MSNSLRQWPNPRLFDLVADAINVLTSSQEKLIIDEHGGRINRLVKRILRQHLEFPSGL